MLLFSLAACAAPPATRPYFLHLPGIGGERYTDHWLVNNLPEAGFDAEFVIHDWTEGKVGIPALTDAEKHKAHAKVVADMITKVRRAEPKRPIWISGHSAGAGVGCWALEQLPEDIQVDGWLMFAPALSPDYDLTRALRHVDGKVHVFSSTLDAAVLNAGTKLFGTVDGVKSDAAGLRGFNVPKGADADQYRKLVDHPFRAAWTKRYGSVGSHICCMRPTFVKEYVVAVVRTGRAPDEAATRPVKTLIDQHAGAERSAAPDSNANLRSDPGRR